MSESTSRRLRILFNQLRGENTDEITYENMQRILPTDPITGDPYSQHQIWAWMRGADTTDLDARLNYWGGDFVQTIRSADGFHYSFRMELPGNNNILTLLTTQEGANARAETLRNTMARRYGYKGDVFIEEIKPLNLYNPASKESVITGRNFIDDDDDYEEIAEFDDDNY